MRNNQILRPTPQIIQNYIERWNSLENYVLQENSLDKLFLQTYPYNEDINDVLIKVCSLNEFYSTNIFSPFTVAKHIIKLDIDDAINKGDLSIVNKIAGIIMNGGKKKNFYSFASKYCSHHNPLVFPIYDSYVEKMLIYFNKVDKFSVFKKIDLKDFKKFKEILISFKRFYNLSDFNLKQIDQYLWLAGKEFFPKKY